jgi:hypothetical protein
MEILRGILMFALGFAAAFLAWFLYQQIVGRPAGPSNSPVTTGGIPLNLNTGA